LTSTRAAPAGTRWVSSTTGVLPTAPSVEVVDEAKVCARGE
jgi:hypothetical protein